MFGHLFCSIRNLNFEEFWIPKEGNYVLQWFHFIFGLLILDFKNNSSLARATYASSFQLEKSISCIAALIKSGIIFEIRPKCRQTNKKIAIYFHARRLLLWIQSRYTISKISSFIFIISEKFINDLVENYSENIPN